jgi:hypothetical protein
MATAYIIGNGPSRREVHLSELEGTTFGCNAIYRDFKPDYLLSGDAGVIKEICASKYPAKNKCIFPDWSPVPYAYKEIVLEPFRTGDYEIEESNPHDLKHVQIFGNEHDGSKQVHVIGCDPIWRIEDMKGTEDEPEFSINFFAGSNALAQASIMGFDKIGLIGFDSIWNFTPNTYQNIYAGTQNYKREKETSRLRIGTNDPNSMVGTQESQIKKVLDKFRDIEYTIYYSGNKNPMGEALWAPLKYDSFK